MDQPDAPVIVTDRLDPQEWAALLDCPTWPMPYEDDDLTLAALTRDRDEPHRSAA